MLHLYANIVLLYYNRIYINNYMNVYILIIHITF